MSNGKASEVPEPKHIKNGEHMDLWEAIWLVKAEISGMKAELRILAALLTAGIAAAIGVVVGVNL